MKFYNYTYTRFVYMIGRKMTLTSISYVDFLGFTQWAISPSECPGLFIRPWKRLTRLMFRNAIFYFVIYWNCITDPVSPRVWSRGFIYLDWFDSLNGLQSCVAYVTHWIFPFLQKNLASSESYLSMDEFDQLCYIYINDYI